MLGAEEARLYSWRAAKKRAARNGWACGRDYILGLTKVMWHVAMLIGRLESSVHGLYMLHVGDSDYLLPECLVKKNMKN